MKSVGEVMAIGRTFKESFLKASRSLETGKRVGSEKIDPEKIRERLITPNPERLNYLRAAFEGGMSVDEVFEYTKIDPWFLRQLQELAEMANSLRQEKIESISPALLREAKRMGFSDLRLAFQMGTSAEVVRQRRKSEKIVPVFKRVDTCAAEFESFTPYLYSTYEEECEASPTTEKKIMILGSGPNRIGQGIEFDYCCCHASFALKEDGFETIMVNCNPETVSTDYDTSDRLYFEPLTFEDVMHIVEREKPDGVIVQFGGQTPLNLALSLQAAGVPIIGTSPESIDLAEDRKRFGKLLSDLQIPQPPSGTAISYEEAAVIAQRIGFPVLVRPSYVLGGRAMVICYDLKTLESYMDEAVDVSQDRPILIDKFLEDAFEVDVDTLADGQDVVIGGIMEHIEEAGIHSGDSSCALPTYLVKAEHLETMRRYTRTLAKALSVVGLMNVQYAIKDDVVYVLEVNPRASRTVPFVSKATGVPLAKVAARLMTGKKLADFNLADELPVKNFFVKSPVFPFAKFPGVDTILGPEMKSTGEVMGVSDNFGQAYAKAQMSASVHLPRSGTAFISVNQHDKKNVIRIADRLHQLGFNLIATRGTATALEQSGIPVESVYKVNEGRPHIVDMIKSGKVDLILNTPLGKSSFFDERAIRRAAMQHGVPCITTLSGGAAVASGIAALQRNKVDVLALQEYHEAVKEKGL
jgi:carbamoyl-phosphate synthase large subunit